MPAPTHRRYTLHGTATHCWWSTGNQHLMFYSCVLHCRSASQIRSALKLTKVLLWKTVCFASFISGYMGNPTS